MLAAYDIDTAAEVLERIAVMRGLVREEALRHIVAWANACARNFQFDPAQGAEAAVLPWGLTLSTAVVAILVFTGWKGGELVYRHGVGVQSGADYYGRRRPRPEDEERTLH